MSVYGKSVVVEEFTFTKRIKVLNLTVDLGGNKGATQVFSTETQQNSTVKQAENWSKLLNTSD